uniref:Centrosomal protein of 44 kDa n=1 Tax=Strigamia maritima TaxID=126957 RepID=T1IQW9_STRMM
MATGDIKNNIRKMQSELRKMRFLSELDLEGVTSGSWQAFEPVYQFAFGMFSNPVADEIQEKVGFQLGSRNGWRFHEGLYRLLRDIYKYKPPVTKDQFATVGFAERKIIMCTEILQMVQSRHGEITGRFSRSSQFSSSSDSAGKMIHPSRPETGSIGSAPCTPHSQTTSVEADLPIMEANTDNVPEMAPENQTVTTEGEGEGDDSYIPNAEATTFWDFQKIVEKNFNLLLSRITLLESRMAAMETKLETVHPKNSLIQRVKPMVKST